MEKILIIHNNYQDLGGEDIAVKNEVKLLSKYFDVKVLYFSNTITSYIKQFFYFLLNRNLESEKLLEKEILEFKPDFAYVHNTWFKASLGIFSVLKKRKVKTIVKLHNFRYDCTRSYFAYKHFQDDKFCQKCGLNKKDSVFFNKYFKESFLKSLLVNYYGKKYFQILKNSKFKIFVLTNFHKQYLLNIGFKEERLCVYPNYIEKKEFVTDKNKNNDFIYAGRVSKEKGIEELIETFLSAGLEGFTLNIIGKGPDLEFYKEKYLDSRVKFLGQIPNVDVLNIISNSYLVISTTKLYEGQPTLLCEASASGVPSIFPLTGGINEFFPEEYKFSFKQYDYEDLKLKILLSADKDLNMKIGKENKKYINQHLDEKALVKNFACFLDE